MTTSLLAQVTVINGVKRKNLEVAGDLVVEGDLTITGTLVVGGDLLVKGACNVQRLHCLGHVTIENTLTFGETRCPGVLDCGADCIGEALYVLPDFHTVLEGVKKSAPVKRALAYHQQREAQSLFIREENAYKDGGGHTVKVKNDLTVINVEIHGGLQVGGQFQFSDARIFGSSTIDGSLTGTSIEMSGSARIEQAIDVRKRLVCLADLSCRWHCEGGEIEVHGDLDARHAILATRNLVCGGHVISGNRIQVKGHLDAQKSIQSASSIFAGKGIASGKKYGIHAGLQVPGTHLREHGYIAAPTKPRRIVSGVYLDDRPYRKLKRSQRISWPADDGADGVY